LKLFKRIVLGLLLLVVVAVGALAFTLARTDDCGPPAWEETVGESMRSTRYRCYGGPEVVEVVSVAVPQPAEDELLVRVHSAAVNPLDWHYLRGSPYFMRLQSGLGKPRDTRLGVDFAGVVEAVGSGVTRFQPGDRVFGGAAGAFSDYLVVRETRAVAHIPEGVAFESAASVGIAGLTALQALRDEGRLEAGQRVLINGASGGVGTFAVQIASAMGAEVHGVCSTRNVERVLGIGADRVFDYKKEDYTESGEKYDLIVDMVGNNSVMANSAMLTPAGRLVIVGGAKGDWIGPLAGPLTALAASPFVEQELITLFATLRSDDLTAVADMMAAGQVKPMIDRHYPLPQIAEAIRYSETGRARGKIIIDIAAVE
jgi:NADPH:quinone reductase-like Zn-dependent oxidoreductase